jgi:hypothetical protein
LAVMGLLKKVTELIEGLALTRPKIVPLTIDCNGPNTAISAKPRLRLASHRKSLQHFESA